MLDTARKVRRVKRTYFTGTRRRAWWRGSRRRFASSRNSPITVSPSSKSPLRADFRPSSIFLCISRRDLSRLGFTFILLSKTKAITSVHHTSPVRPLSDSKELIQDQRFKGVHAPKHWIIGYQASRTGMCGGGCLECIGSPQAMEGAKARRQVRDLQMRGSPFQVGIGGQQAVELIHALLIGVMIG